jgi:hypothetical protein
MKKEQAATQLKVAQHDVAMPPPAKKRKYRIVNERLAKFKQDYAQGQKSALQFLRVAGHLLKLD